MKFNSVWNADLQETLKVLLFLFSIFKCCSFNILAPLHLSESWLIRVNFQAVINWMKTGPIYEIFPYCESFHIITVWTQIENRLKKADCCKWVWRVTFTQHDCWNWKSSFSHQQSFRHSAASCLKIILKVRFAEILLERHL